MCEMQQKGLPQKRGNTMLGARVQTALKPDWHGSVAI